MENTKIQLNDLVSRRTIILLEKYHIYSIEDFFDRCAKKYFWGTISNDIFIGDRIKLEKLLLNNRSIDTYAYYPPKGADTRDYFVKYEIITKDDGNLKNMTSPHISYTRIVIDRLKRTIEVTLKNDLNEQINTSIGVVYWQIEDFFERLEGHSMHNAHAFTERTSSLKITLYHISGNEDVFGPYDVIENEYDITELLKKSGVDIKRLCDNLTNSNVDYDAIKKFI